ncbi:MAG: energy transducer TonB [Candidatus Didemnitutus sp.]|nr:energy transducer TonB [Candidatus Didemnitutus sp.]
MTSLPRAFAALLLLLAAVLTVDASLLRPERATAAVSDRKYSIEYGPLPHVLTLTSRVKPAYPKELRQRGVEGTVYVKFQVNGSGNVVEARGTSGESEELISLATNAVKRWRFLPVSIADRAAYVIADVTITFRLEPATATN